MMKTSHVVFGLVAVLVGVAGWALGQQAQPEPRKAEASAGYSVASAGDGAILIETTTGRTWLLHRSIDGARSAWLPIERIDAPEKARTWWIEQEEQRLRLKKMEEERRKHEGLPQRGEP
jgi:hypothetical protein